MEGSAVYKETVTATAQDQTHGVVSARCNVTIEFVTRDETEIWPEDITIAPSTKQYLLSVVKTGDRSNPSVSYQGFDTVKLQASALPDCPDGESYGPYAGDIRWSSDDPQVLAVAGTEPSVRPRALPGSRRR